MRENPFSADRGIDMAFAAKRREAAQEKERKLIETAHRKAVASFADEEPIDPRKFHNYDADKIEADLKYVSEMEEVFEKQATPETREAQKLALILEAIMHEQIELNEWLGPDVVTKKASRFDDIANGVDSIAEFEQNMAKTYLALALDMTYGNPAKKFERIKEEIDKGRLGKVKYFESSDGEFQGTLTKVPRAIVGADRRAILELADLWLKKDNKRLAAHPVQLQLLEEITLQLEIFIKYAEARGKEEVTDILKRNLSIMQSIARGPQKQKLARSPGATDYREEDRVFGRMLEELKIFAV